MFIIRRTTLIILIGLGLQLAGCANTQSQSAVDHHSLMSNVLIAEPLPFSLRTQHAIARYNHILSTTKLGDAEIAELLYQRGILYDSVGLAGLARYDFDQALRLKPDMAEAYNSLGIHLTQQMEFSQAYEMFDSSLEINPQYEFAYLNRGIALYYGGRFQLAQDDLNIFYSLNQADPYRALWRYLAATEVNQAKAMETLATQRDQLKLDHWAISLVDFYLGRITEQRVLTDLISGIQNQRQLADRLCEAYFYLGKYHRSQNNLGVAANYFKLALSTNVFEYVEHRYARMELLLLREAISQSRADS